MLEALSYPFMQRALIAGVLVGLTASFFGVFVVQRRMSFLGSGLAHAALGGVALGLFLETEPLFVAIPFTVAVALLIAWVRDRTELGGDTAVFFSLSVALGVVLLALKSEYAVDAMAFLFGSVLAVTTGDILAVAAVAFATLLLLPYWGRWAYATFDRDLARADKLPVTWDDYLLTAMVAAVVVSALKVVGILLVAAFLVLPAASARLFSRTFAQMTLLSVVFGVLGVVFGLFLSYLYDIPSGATITLFEAGLFLLALLVARKYG